MTSATDNRTTELLPWQEEYFDGKSDEFKNRSLAHMTHGIGERYPRLYGVWQSMRSRCNNPNRKKYPMYGGRGIYVCDEWNNSIEAFAEWALEEGYSEGLQLDRIDNDGPYCPENCRWVTRKENCRNTRRNKYLTLCGIRKTVAEWCETLDISEYTIYYWIREHGEKGCEKRVYERLANSL